MHHTLHVILGRALATTGDPGAYAFINRPLVRSFDMVLVKEFFLGDVMPYAVYSLFLVLALYAGVVGPDDPIPTYDERVDFHADEFEKRRAETIDPHHIWYNQMERWVLNEAVLNPSIIIMDAGIRADRMGRADKQLNHQSDSMLLIQQYGHDYRPGGTPVLGLGMVEIETSLDTDRDKRRRQHLIRMVRSPRSPGMTGENGDFRGKYVWDLFEELREMQPEVPLKEIIRQIPFERWETKLESCNPALEVFEEIWDQKFAPVKDSYVSRYLGEVEMSFDVGGERSTYKGDPKEKNTPVIWALRFVEALEPCWKRVEGDFSVDLD